jgi:hypothetical protein
LDVLPLPLCCSLQYLVLGWCVSQRDVEVVRKIVEQLCVAWKPQGGTTVSTSKEQQLFKTPAPSGVAHCAELYILTSGQHRRAGCCQIDLTANPKTTKTTHRVLAVLLQIVVLTQRSKLEMEGMFWRCLPESKRFGTKLVFRQGSPLVPSDLRLVGANRAAAIIVVSDQSRSAAEADAQSVR